MSLLPGKFYLDDFFDDFVPMGRTKEMGMKCDIYEKGGNVHIEKEDKEKNYFRKERIYGSYKRQFTVGNIKENEINAKFNNGLLEISFPKEEKKETKKFIEIK